MDLSRLCSVAVQAVSIESVSLASVRGTVTVAVTSRAPARLELSEIRFDILPADVIPEQIIVHGWAENVSLGAYSTTDVPVPVSVTSLEAISFLAAAMTRDVDARVRGNAVIDAYISKITIPFDEVVTIPSLLTR